MQENTPDNNAAAEQSGRMEPTLSEAGRTEPTLSETGDTAAKSDAEELLRKAEAAAQEQREAFLRAKAEMENVRKRAQADVVAAHKFAVEKFATELLAVKDSLEAALVTDAAQTESIKSGVELTLKQLKSVFEKFDVSEDNPAGEKFDPHRHQAISAVESDAEPNTVVQVLQKGYKLHERVIRPALVIVAKSKNVES